MTLSLSANCCGDTYIPNHATCEALAEQVGAAITLFYLVIVLRNDFMFSPVFNRQVSVLVLFLSPLKCSRSFGSSLVQVGCLEASVPVFREVWDPVFREALVRQRNKGPLKVRFRAKPH
jgi:hypothetical protein